MPPQSSRSPFLLPHWSIRKYMGTRPTSQKTKKSNRSSDMKTPSMPVSSARNRNMNTRGFSSTVKEARIARGVSRVVSSTMLIESPSTPM